MREKNKREKKKQEVEDKSGEEENGELNKARILLVMDGSSWLERRKEGGVSHGRFSISTISSCSETTPTALARLLALRAATVDSSVQRSPARRAEGSGGLTLQWGWGGSYGFGCKRLVTCARHMLLR